MTEKLKNILKNQIAVEKNIQKELKEIKGIIKSDEDDDVKLDSIKAILNELVEEIAEAKVEAVIESRTGLFGARFGEDYLEKEIEKSRRSKKEICVALIDIDFLKYVNDNFGHVVGTKAILEISKVIKNNVRKSDMVSRYGGDEFLIVFSEDCNKAKKALERIRKEVLKIKVHTGVQLSVSIGNISYNGKEKITAERLIEKADKILYGSKEKRVNLNLK